MSMQSSPGFDPFSAFFIKHAEKTVRDDRGKSHTENVLLPLLTDLFHLLLSDGVTPHLWHKVIITPRHKKGPITSPPNYRLLAINGCIYRLFANMVRDLLMDWALAEHQIPDSQFGFCPTRNTNQPLLILKSSEHLHFFHFCSSENVSQNKEGLIGVPCGAETKL